MKKLVFTIQVVALVAFFPVYLVAELSNATAEPHAKKPASAIEEITGKNKVQAISVDADTQVSFLMIK